jgi:hypothetical protein
MKGARGSLSLSSSEEPLLEEPLLEEPLPPPRPCELPDAERSCIGVLFWSVLYLCSGAVGFWVLIVFYYASDGAVCPIEWSCRRVPFAL